MLENDFLHNFIQSLLLLLFRRMAAMANELLRGKICDFESKVSLLRVGCSTNKRLAK
jgi:hypothetical protein